MNNKLSKVTDPSSPIKPLFLFGLPRSGSTLVQRLLASHQAIHTTAEPWILLPHIYATRSNGTYTDYARGVGLSAITDFCQTLPLGEKDYQLSLRSFILDLYGKASPDGKEYFLDKTPTYHFIVDEILSLFPEAKFIFLWRNPLAMMSSITETWGKGRWIVHKYHQELFAGQERLINAYVRNRDKVESLQYEALLLNPKRELIRICHYLGIDYHADILKKFSEINFEGQRGDQTGAKKYQSITSAPINKWQDTLTNPYRKHWAVRYMKWLGRENLSQMGYDMDEIINEIDSIPFSLRQLFLDLFRVPYGKFYVALGPGMLRDRIDKLITKLINSRVGFRPSSIL